MKLRMKNIKYLVPISFLLIIILFSCKKKEERYLINYYEGTYAVTQISVSCCDPLGHPISSKEEIELEVKKSCKGIKIKGVQVFENFEVNYKDSTISAENKNSDERANGKFYPNDSIYLWVSFSSKLPNGKGYSMKKK
jgi:hypothetical protein